jgi:flagellar FliL protein
MADSEEAVPAVEAPAAKTSKMIPMMIVLNTLLMVGVLVFVMKRPAGHSEGGAGEHGKPEAEEKSEHGKEDKGGGGHGKEGPASGPTIRFENFTVQLKSNDVERYAHTSIELELTDDAAKALVEKRTAPIRDAVLGYLTDRTAEELRGSEGLKQMKEALLKRLDEIIPGKRITTVFITDFIIQ